MEQQKGWIPEDIIEYHTGPRLTTSGERESLLICTDSGVYIAPTHKQFLTYIHRCCHRGIYEK